MNSFIFVRHGRTADNAKGNIPADDAVLTKQGQAEARKAGRALKKKGITVVASSPLPRAKETADIIAKELGVTDVRVLPELTERGYGELAGKKRTEPTEWYFVADTPGVEPAAAVFARAYRALAEITSLTEEDTVLVVGHAVLGYYLQQAAAGVTDVRDMAPVSELDNGAFTEVTIRPVRSTFPWQLAAGIIGLVLLVVGVGWALIDDLTPAQSPEVKQQTIQLPSDAFNGDPALQGAVQKLQQGGTDTPQTQSPAPNQGSPGSLLQPVGSGK